MSVPEADADLVALGFARVIRYDDNSIFHLALSEPLLLQAGFAQHSLLKKQDELLDEGAEMYASGSMFVDQSAKGNAFDVLVHNAKFPKSCHIAPHGRIIKT